MNLCSTLTLFFGLACLVLNPADASLRAVPLASARRELQTFPYAFFVSETTGSDGDPWCMTALNGVENGDYLGFFKCDFEFPREDQLFLLDSDGKIHPKEDPSQCFAIQNDTPTDGGNSRVLFQSCNSQLNYNTFTHDRGESDTLRLADDLSYCIKQTGNGPDTTDSFRTFECDDVDVNDVGIYFDYMEYECVINAFSGVDDCCDDDDCSGSATCQDYKCTSCNVNDANTECCVDSDCDDNEVCDGNECAPTIIVPTAPPSACNTDNLGTECCNDNDCSRPGYTCEDEACVTAPFFLVSNYASNTDWCVSANNGVGGWAPVGFEPCTTSNTPATQLWRHDTQGRIRNNSDLSRCMITGPEGDTFSGFGMVMGSCRLNEFRFGSLVSDQVRLAQDERYCLTSFDENADGGGRMGGRPCESTGRFEFERDFI